jgi:outer membrane protein insertion porin family
MRLKEGQPLDEVALDRDMEMLFRYFESVRVTTEQVPGGVVIRFLVSENPLVVQLNLYGLDAMNQGEVRELMTTRPGLPLFPYALATDAENIVEEYKVRGYHFAHVPEPVVTALPGGGRRVDFTIVEGPEVEVDRIVFRGNRSVSRADLLEAMVTKEDSGIFSFLSTATFREVTLREDLVALRRLYESRGFLDAEVVLDDLRFSDDKKRACITIAIEEHLPYCVGKVTIRIDRLDPGEAGCTTVADRAYFTEERVRCLLGVAEGQCYSGERIDAGRERLLDEYLKRSYVDAAVPEPLRRGRERENVVDLEFEVVEGPKSRVRRLDFVGNEYTRDKVLRREARFEPGGFVDSRELERTTARLRGLGYFERVSLDVQDARDQYGNLLQGWKDVRYEVQEGSTGQVRFGVGISTDGGLLGQVTYSKRNFDIARWPTSLPDLMSRRAFTGAGQTFDVLFAPGTQISEAAVNFGEPHLFGTDVALNVSLYTRLEFWESYDLQRTGYVVGLQHPVYRKEDDSFVVAAGLSWRHELDHVGSLGQFAVPGAYLFAGDNEVRALQGSIRMGTVDDLAEPTWRTSTSISGELGGTVLGGSVDQAKFALNHEEDFLLFRDASGRRHTLSGRIAAGYAFALEDTPEVPPFERFYLGGRTLRGFAFRGVGPHVNGNPTGGEWLLNGSLEYTYPLIADTLGIVVFLDTGTLGTDVEAPDAFLWRLSTGFGIRLTIPILGDRPLALDFGFRILEQPQDEESLVSFSVGRDF